MTTSGTPRATYLPLPANFSQHSAPVYAPLRRRSRFTLLIGFVLSTGVIYFLLFPSESLDYVPFGRGSRGKGSPDEGLEFSEDSAIVPDREGRLYGLMQPGKQAGDKEASLVQLEVREEPPLYPHPPLPREQTDNPWPGAQHSNIRDFYLSEERLASHLEPSPPQWPSAVSRKHQSLPKTKMVQWRDLYRAKRQDDPVALTQPDEAVRDHNRRLWNPIQAIDFHESEEDVRIRMERRTWVKKAFLHAWRGYKSKAWGHDEVRPVRGLFTNPFNAWGATIVDSLSTLLVMNLTEEYSLARTHVRQIDFTQSLGERSAYGAKGDTNTIPFFETVIRYLGGLISAYDMSGGDTLMLERAEELAGWLMGAFDTRYGLPVGSYTLGTRLEGKYAGRQVLAEVGSFSLELGRLAQITGKMEYYDIVHRATDFLENGFKKIVRPGTLLPSYVDDSKNILESENYGWGAQTDSYYEYLLKASLLFRNSSQAQQYYEMYDHALESAQENGLINAVKVVPGADNADLTVFGQLNWNAYFPKLEHLACFTGGLIAMGSRISGKADDLTTAARLTKTCFWAYNATATGLGPETMTFYNHMDYQRFSRKKAADGTPYLKVLGSPPGQQRADRKFQGRPETIESIFYLWRITGDPVWQERGWAMFTAWVEHTIVPYGFAGLTNVNSPNARKVDAMESYVLAETFKYYYLLFSPPDYVSLDDYVFNTEAHPLKLPTADSAPSFTPSWKPSKLDDELAERYKDPEHPSDFVGGGTSVQLELLSLEVSKLPASM